MEGGGRRRSRLSSHPAIFPELSSSKTRSHIPIEVAAHSSSGVRKGREERRVWMGRRELIPEGRWDWSRRRGGLRSETRKETAGDELRDL